MAIVGKNLVTTPRWDTDARPFAWQQTDVAYDSPGVPATLVADAAADPITGGAGYAASSSSTATGAIYVPLGHLDPGEYSIWVWRNIKATATDIEIGLAPLVDGWAIIRSNAFSGKPVSQMKHKYSWPGAGFQTVEATVTIPDVTGWETTSRDSGKLVMLPDSSLVEWALYVMGGKRNNNLVGGVRVDAAPLVVPGYIDGSMESEDYTFSWEGDPFDSITLADESSEIVVPPPAAEFHTDPAEYVLPDDDAAIWYVDAEPVEPGTYPVEPTAETVTVTVTVEPAEGYLFDPLPEPQTFTWTFDPPPNDGEAEAVQLMTRLMGAAEESTDDLAAAYHMVRLFVWEYTRGKGFDVGGKPKPGLMAVIVSGACRLATNPEQATMYQLDGITVRPAVFNGYTLAEQGVLHRYRRRFA